MYVDSRNLCMYMYIHNYGTRLLKSYHVLSCLDDVEAECVWEAYRKTIRRSD